MLKVIPEYRGRSADVIVSENICNESSGYIYRALSWLDLAKRKRSSPAFQYAAHDTRQGIEQLLFEELVLSTGAALSRDEYQKCLGNSTKLHAIIKRLSPEREKLARFTQAIMSVASAPIDLVIWDHGLLMKHWGTVSDYLHWSGAIDETIDSWPWVEEGISKTEQACSYIWRNQTERDTAVSSKDMHPEMPRFGSASRQGALVLRRSNLVEDSGANTRMRPRDNQ